MRSILCLASLVVASGRQNSSVQALSLSVSIPKPPAFLQHADDVCNCAFNDKCSCDGALTFMKCIRDGCNSGVCTCMTKDGVNHFRNACEEMSSECPGIGMECGVEQATCGDDSVIWYGKEPVLSRRYQKMNEGKLELSKPVDDAEEQKDSEDDTKEQQDAEDDNKDETSDEGAEPGRPVDEKLPPGWEAYWSEEYNKMYYSNEATGEVTWTKPKMKPSKEKRLPSSTEEPRAAAEEENEPRARAEEENESEKDEQGDVISKHHYHAKVKELNRHQHHTFAKGIITTIIVLCLTVCLASSKDNMISTNTWSTIDAVVCVFLSLMWYYVVVHYLDFAHYTGGEKVIAHLTIGILVLLVCSMISLYMKKRADANKADSESADIFNTVSDPIIMWINAGAVSTAQQLAKPHPIYVLGMTGVMMFFFTMVAIIWYQGIGRIIKNKRWSEDTINNMTGGALAAGIHLWVQMMVVGEYQTIEEPRPKAPNLDKTLVLNAFGLLYLVIAVVLSAPVNKLLQNYKPERMYVKWRVVSVLKIFVNWLPYFSCLQALGHLIIDNSGYQAGAIEARLLHCSATTFVGTGFIIMCAKVEAIRSKPTLCEIFVGLGGFMVGAAWAGLLNNSINLMVEGVKHPFLTKLEVSMVLTACVLPTYFYYLKPLINQKTNPATVTS